MAKCNASFFVCYSNETECVSCALCTVHISRTLGSLRSRVKAHPVRAFCLSLKKASKNNACVSTFRCEWAVRNETSVLTSSLTSTRMQFFGCVHQTYPGNSSENLF